jgi:amidase
MSDSCTYLFLTEYLLCSQNFIKSAVWNAGAGEDYRVATAPSGEPLIASMSLVVEDTDSAERPLFRPLSDGISAYELWQAQKRKLGLRQEYLDHWNSTVTLTGTGRPVDAIISPMAAYVAPPHGKNEYVLYTHNHGLTVADDS